MHAVTPVTIPVEPTVALALLELQVPDPVLLKVLDEPTHIAAPPVKMDTEPGVGLTVMPSLTLQPVAEIV